MGNCRNCGKIKELRAKELCNNCYKRIGTPLLVCKGCGQTKHHKGKGYCAYCYNKTFYKEYFRFRSRKQYSGISEELFGKIPKSCVICGFDKIVEFHHIVPKAKGGQTDLTNLVVLCPNHHKMLHHADYMEEILKELKKLNS